MPSSMASHLRAFTSPFTSLSLLFHSTPGLPAWQTTGYGKNKTIVIDSWEVVGIEGLTTAGFYGPLGSGSHETRKDFV